MITIATAECFTHGFIAHELHVLAQGYKDKFGSNFEDLINDMDTDHNINKIKEFEINTSHKNKNSELIKNEEKIQNQT